MNYSFLILTFFIFILPFSYLKRIYSIDSPSYRLLKIINITICFLFIYNLSTEDSNLRTIITKFSEFKDYYFVDLGGISKWTMFIGKIILILVNFYLIVVLVNIARRNSKYRQIFIKVLILYIPLKGLDIYRLAFDKIDVIWTKLVLVSLFTSIVFLLPIIIFYSTGPVKKMMIEDKILKDQIIDEIKNKNKPY